MAGALLKLAQTHASPVAQTLRFEQRRSPRYHVTGRATAVTPLSPSEGRHSRIRSLQLINMSDTGLGAICQDALEPGTSVAIFLPPHGPDHGLDIYGQVVRCTPKDYGHEIGIRFDVRPAA